MAKLEGRERRKARIRKRISGTSERPRLSVFRSARHIYAQVVDDSGGGTLAAASTLSPDLRGTLEADDKTGAAKKGFLYHGRIKALAEAAREAGLNF